MARLLIIAGLILVVAGLVLHFFPQASLLGRLPGDVRVERPGFRFYFPITTSILVSIVLTVILWLVSRRG